MYYFFTFPLWYFTISVNTCNWYKINIQKSVACLCTNGEVLVVFVWHLQSFLYTVELGYFYFFFLAWLLWLQFPVLCWIEVLRESILVLRTLIGLVWYCSCTVVAWGISVPWSGIEPGPWQWKPQILIIGSPGNYQGLSLSRLWFFQWSCMDVRVGLWRKLSAEKLMLLNCGVGEDSWESLGLQGDPTCPS